MDITGLPYQRIEQMEILKYIKWGSTELCCGNCKHFANDAKLIEYAYPGLTALSSGFAAVRDRDGLCKHHQLYLSAADSCGEFSAIEPKV